MTTDITHKKFNEGKFLLYDATNMPYPENKHFTHFALTDALIIYAGKHNQPILHFWQTPPLAILGMMDTKIGHFQKALPVFDHHQHDYMLRNSGGLGIISDPGVLNVSLIYPSKNNQLSIDEGYNFMLDFMRETFYPHYLREINPGEISESYCFGDYDLSIDGRKIAGIAQRRIQDGVAIMMYVSVNGDQEKRAKLMRDFYEVGRDGSEPEGRYPDVNPAVMTTLADVYEEELSVAQVKEWMLGHFSLEDGLYKEEIDQDYQVALKKMNRRNMRFFGEDFVKDSVKEG